MTHDVKPKKTKTKQNRTWHILAKARLAALQTLILRSPGVDKRGNRVPKGTTEEDKEICSSLEGRHSNGCFHQTLMAFPD